jgi:triosephosphate isomerase
MVKKLIVGNWKMNSLTGEAADRVSRIAHAENIVLCPSFTSLGAVRQALAGKPSKLGAQDCHAATHGAFTGDISALMLRDAGCAYVILGHSERRSHHQESGELVRKKAAAAHKAGLIAIVCVGETEKERKEGKYTRVVEEQLLHSLPEGASAANTVIAYEPVWAIGTGNTATPADITEMHDFIARLIRNHFPGWGGDAHALYGGSVKAANAKEILAIATVGGALVGGASLDPAEFNAIAAAAITRAAE